MTSILAFDVYGTLINTHGVVSKLKAMIGDSAGAFSQTWRDKQLEYSFRRGLMQAYEDFSVCTRQAMDYTCSHYNVSLSNEQKAGLLKAYRTLPAFDDVADSLDQLKSAGFRLYAFSNGSAALVDELLTAANIRDHFLGIVSVDDIQTFKPNPTVYHYFLEQADATAEASWLISSNPFDVIGALSAGMKAAWVQRSKDAVFDPWGIYPTLTISGLNNLGKAIATFE